MEMVDGGAGTRRSFKKSRGNRGAIYGLNQAGGIYSTCLRLAFDHSCLTREMSVYFRSDTVKHQKIVV